MVLRRRKVVALARAHERDDRDAGSRGGVELEQTPRAGKHFLGLEEDDYVRVEDMTNQLVEVAEVARVCAAVEANVYILRVRRHVVERW